VIRLLTLHDQRGETIGALDGDRGVAAVLIHGREGVLSVRVERVRTEGRIHRFDDAGGISSHATGHHAMAGRGDEVFGQRSRMAGMVHVQHKAEVGSGSVLVHLQFSSVAATARRGGG
jgi:hypothetical protein